MEVNAVTVLSSVYSSFKDFEGNFLTEVFLLFRRWFMVSEPVQSALIYHSLLIWFLRLLSAITVTSQTDKMIENVNSEELL